MSADQEKLEKEKLFDSLTCGICLDFFRWDLWKCLIFSLKKSNSLKLTAHFNQNWPAIFRHPLMLPCQHVYCYGCLYQLKRENNIKCPYCQIPIDSKFEDLPQPRSGLLLTEIALSLKGGPGRVAGCVHFTIVQKRLIMNLMEMCSKGTPSIETEELKRKYPAERVIENVPNDENEYPAECGPSLFW